MTDSLLCALEKADKKAFDANWSYIQPDALIESIFDLHDDLMVAYQSAIDKLTENQKEALTDCLQALRKEFLFATLTCLRAHSTDAESYRRKAIEFCCFAVQIARCKHSATVWLAATKSKTKYDQYRKHFKIVSILKSTMDVGVDLSKLYDQLCHEVHASVYAIKTQTRILVTPAGKRINWLDYHDDSNEAERYALAQRFLTAVYFDFILVQIFVHAFWNEYQVFDLQKWKQKANVFYEFYQTESERIKALPKP